MKSRSHAVILGTPCSEVGIGGRLVCRMQSMLFSHAYLALVIVVFVGFGSILGWATWHNP